MTSLTHRTFSAAKWIALETILKNILVFGAVIVMARLLQPSDFGVIALLGLPMAVAIGLAEGGLGAAAVQAKTLTDLECSTLFWTQLGASLVLACIMMGLGPVFAHVWQLDILIPLSIAFAINIPVAAAANLQVSLFTRRLEYRTPTVAHLLAVVASTTAGISAALLGMGVWALFLQSFSLVFVTLLVLWLKSPWRPTMSFSIAAVKKYWSFGAFTAAAAMVDDLEIRVTPMVLGGVAPPEQIGFYARASSLQQQMVRSLSRPVAGVSYPAFSRAQDNPASFLRGLRQAAFLNFTICAMFMWQIGLSADWLVPWALGDKWFGMVVPFQAFLFVAGFFPLVAVFSRATRAMGRPDLVFFQNLLRTVGVLVVALLSVQNGIGKMAWAQAFLLLSLLSVPCVLVRRIAGYRLRQQAIDLLPIVLAGGGQFLVACLIGTVVGDPEHLSGAARALSFGAGMATFLVVLFTAALVQRDGSGRLAGATIRKVLKRS
jgi:O-antigen/teichoic acid export membrane protein